MHMELFKEFGVQTAAVVGGTVYFGDCVLGGPVLDCHEEAVICDFNLADSLRAYAASVSYTHLTLPTT